MVDWISAASQGEEGRHPTVSDEGEAAEFHGWVLCRHWSVLGRLSYLLSPGHLWGRGCCHFRAGSSPNWSGLPGRCAVRCVARSWAWIYSTVRCAASFWTWIYPMA